MKMMGIGGTTHWLSWFITSLVLLTASVAAMTALLCAGSIFERSNPWIIFIFLELFAVATIMLAFAISVFFSKVCPVGSRPLGHESEYTGLFV